jgi:hypothetical protein
MIESVIKHDVKGLDMTSPLKTTLILTMAAAACAGAVICQGAYNDMARSQSSAPTPQTKSVAGPNETQSAQALVKTSGLISLRPRVTISEITPEIATRQIALTKTPDISKKEHILDGLGRTNISVARLHEGRFLPTPHQEARAWTSLKLGKVAFTPLPASTHFDVLPSISQNGVDSDNKIDEIRLAAVKAKSEYVLIYAVGKDAFWGEFGGRAIERTGLTVDEASPARENGDAKALLVQAHNGRVLGAVTTWAPDMQTLTAEVKSMIEQL